MTPSETALALYELGYHPTRCCTPKCGYCKSNKSKGKVPHYAWHHLKLQDRRHVARLFAKGTPNVGVRTDWPLVILDIDTHDGQDGFGDLEKLAASHDYTIPPLTVVSGGRGAHIWYRLPVNATKIKTNGNLADSLNTRVEGIDNYGISKKGQAIVPPSVHLSGARYEWVNGLPPKMIDLPEMPAWMVSMITVTGRSNKIYDKKSVSQLSSVLENIDSVRPDKDGWDATSRRHFYQNALQKLIDAPKGERHQAIFRAACDAQRLWNACPPRHIPSLDIMLHDIRTEARVKRIDSDAEIERHIQNGLKAAAHGLWLSQTQEEIAQQLFGVNDDMPDYLKGIR